MQKQVLTFYKVDCYCKMLLSLDNEKPKRAPQLLTTTMRTSHARFTMIHCSKNGKFTGSRFCKVNIIEV